MGPRQERPSFAMLGSEKQYRRLGVIAEERITAPGSNSSLRKAEGLWRNLHTNRSALMHLKITARILDQHRNLW